MRGITIGGETFPPKRQLTGGDSPDVQADCKRLKPSGPREVFIFDLDETLIIFNSLINGKFPLLTTAKEIEEGKRTATKLMNLIYQIADKEFFFKDLEAFDARHIGDIVEDGGTVSFPLRGRTAVNYLLYAHSHSTFIISSYQEQMFMNVA